MLDYHVYAIPNCPWCKRARTLLDYAAGDYLYTVINNNIEKQKLLDEWQVPDGERTWPQIFLDGKRIGGYTELKAHLTANL